MARLCVRVAPNENSDKTLNALRTHEGDVVCIVDDNHQFSFCELNNGQYKIIDVPGVPQEELIYLCEHVEDVEGKMTARRVVKLDEKALGKASMTKAEIAAITKVKV